jgi:hypothetical protein
MLRRQSQILDSRLCLPVQSALFAEVKMPSVAVERLAPWPAQVLFGGRSGAFRPVFRVGCAGSNRPSCGPQQERWLQAASQAGGRGKSVRYGVAGTRELSRFDSTSGSGIGSMASEFRRESQSGLTQVISGTCPAIDGRNSYRRLLISAAAGDFGGLRRSWPGEVKQVFGKRGPMPR